MKIQIKNIDDKEEVFVSGIEKEIANRCDMEDKKTRFVIRPGETRDFCITPNEILGIEIL